MRFFITSVLLCFAPFLPSSAENVGEAGHRIIAFSEGLKAAAENDVSWKVCGDYFAAAESTEGKIVHFTFESGAPGHEVRTLTLISIDRISISVEEKVAAPVVTVLWNGWDTRFVLKMNAGDYATGLPCIAITGMKI